ncbi:hypothetical protein uan_043 [Pseudomonas phage UAntarctica]|nr:hypothetical protein uan_043 [Pseudomonas phage UAntarctica]
MIYSLIYKLATGAMVALALGLTVTVGRAVFLGV